MPLCTSDSGVSAFQFLMHRRSSFSAPSKFVPLSDQIIEDVIRLEVKRSIAISNELVSMDGTKSLDRIAQVVNQLNRKPQRFSEDRQKVTSNFPKNLPRGSRTVDGGNLAASQKSQTSLE